MAAGLDTGFNPLWQLIDTARVGIAGHSYGAAGVSYVGQRDPRVKTVVAWDALGPPQPGGVRGSGIGGCRGRAERAPAPITKPALNLTADYFIPPTPNTSQPDYEAKAAVSKDYSAAGVDTGSIAIRGGTHYEFSWIPDPAFPAVAARRGPGDLVHDGVVRRLPQGRRERLSGACAPTAGATTRRRPPSTPTRTPT